MKKVLLIFLFASCYCYLNHADAQSSSSEVKRVLIGRWVLGNDKNFVMSIKEDSIVYYYNKKVKHKKSITFSFGDSLFCYKKNNGDFNFMKDNGDIYPGIIIKEYDPIEKDTKDITIIFLDKTGMDLMGGGRTATFKKIK